MYLFCVHAAFRIPGWLKYAASGVLLSSAVTEDPDLMEGIKPKGMHLRTYNRLVDELADVEYLSSHGWAHFISEEFGFFAD